MSTSEPTSLSSPSPAATSPAGSSRTPWASAPCRAAPSPQVTICQPLACRFAEQLHAGLAAQQLLLAVPAGWPEALTACGTTQARFLLPPLQELCPHIRRGSCTPRQAPWRGKGAAPPPWLRLPHRAVGLCSAQPSPGARPPVRRLPPPFDLQVNFGCDTARIFIVFDASNPGFTPFPAGFFQQVCFESWPGSGRQCALLHSRAASRALRTGSMLCE